ncbi:MAG: metal-sensing transcriptional repressor [Candidatus Eremiobacteraeota bacterium]|nr:metal-sensing transcriptional repressor [Candidatus Eremiobacteraeota bacterium]
MQRRAEVDRFRRPLDGERKTDVLNRLKSARGHLDRVIAMVDGDPYVLDVLRQLAAVRGAIDATVRLGLREYFELVFIPAVRGGLSEPAVDELMNALAFLREID